MKFDEKLFNEIRKSKAPSKLLIVPAQLTLSAETAAFNVCKAEGFFDIQVMSGNKLRAEIISKTGGPGRTAINNLGRSMILRKCAKEADLELYSSLITSPDFLKAAGDYIVQSKQNEANDIAIPSDLPDILQKKMSDMNKLSAAYEGYMQGKYIDSEDGLAFATSKIPECEWIRNSEIWFVAFYSFTKREQEFLKALDENSFGCHIILDAPKEEFPKTLKKVFATDSIYEQAERIAAEIFRLIREEKYKAEDIAILSANIEQDGPCFKRLFAGLGIPLYIDEKRSLMHLNIARKIACLLDMLADGLAPYYLIPFVDDPDFTNYVKSYHIKGDAFLKPFKYGGEKKIAAEIKRDEFANLYVPFMEEFNAAKSVKEKSEALYNFLDSKLELPKKIKEDAIRVANEGYITSSEELLQAWSVIVDILDQAVELLGDEELNNGEYRDLIKNAFLDIKIGILPQENGRIELGDLYRSKPYGVKALFISSFNDGCIPRSIKASSILTDDEIDSLNKKGISLCKSYEQLNKEDRIMLFEALEAASEKLYFSYTNSDGEGKSIRPSYLLTGLETDASPSELFTIDALIDRLRLFKSDGKELDVVWQAVANKYKDDPKYQAAVKGLLYKNEDLHLSKENKDKILSPDYISPSALEKYARCPFSYFIAYGLRAEEAYDFNLGARDIGDIYHEVLNRLTVYLSSDGKSARDSKSLWQTITDSEIKKFVDDSIEQIRLEDSTGLFTKGPAEEYQTNKLKDLAYRFAINLVSQLRKGNVDSVSSEENFSFTFHGTKIHGKIDRLDTTKLSDKTLVKVIDYKSGKNEFRKELIEQGLDLQLMLYLESATQGGEKPVGSFYFRISSEIAETDIAHLNLDELTEEVAKKLASQYSLDGAFVAETDAFMTLDKTVQLGEESSVVKAKKGLSEAEYEALRASFKTNLCRWLDDLKFGKISIEPKRLTNSYNACTYCQYKSICKFDPQIEGFKMR